MLVRCLIVGGVKMDDCGAVVVMIEGEIDQVELTKQGKS